MIFVKKYARVNTSLSKAVFFCRAEKLLEHFPHRIVKYYPNGDQKT